MLPGRPGAAPPAAPHRPPVEHLTGGQQLQLGLLACGPEIELWGLFLGVAGGGREERCVGYIGCNKPPGTGGCALDMRFSMVCLPTGSSAPPLPTRLQGRVTPAEPGDYSFAKYNKKVGRLPAWLLPDLARAGLQTTGLARWFLC